MDVKHELKRPRGVATVVGVVGLIGGTATLVIRRLLRRTRPWYERLGHTVKNELPVPRRLTRR